MCYLKGLAHINRELADSAEFLSIFDLIVFMDHNFTVLVKSLTLINLLSRCSRELFSTKKSLINTLQSICRAPNRRQRQS